VKKNSIQIKIGLLLIVAVILLSATCFLAYRNLSSIVSSIQIELTPELRILSIRDISRDLETADNSVRIYTLTKNTSDLRSYYTVINGIDEKMDKLSLECLNDTVMLNQADTISSLIEENIVIWNQLLYLINRDSVAESIKRLSDSIIVVPNETEKRGILKRVFARNRKYYEEERDQLRSNIQEIDNNIQQIEEQGRITKEKLMTRESQLAVTSSRIKEKFYDIIARMENQVSNLVSERGQAANQLAEKTYGWLLIFTVSGGLLALLVLFIIIRYIRNAHDYQVALEKSKNETENLAKAKELFLANVSHEIRTPVTAISGFTEQLLNETFDENVLRSLKIIKSSSDHLARIIDDILDFSKLHSGKLTLEQVHFSLEQIFREVYDIFERQANQKNTILQFSITPGTPPVLLGDPYRLRQILINLVGNSVKFTDQGRILFSASGTANQSGNVDLKIEVADTGIGIDEDKLKIIFDDFTQAEMSTTRKYGGTGLGLSIVKKLVELHHGSVECESKRDHGTIITCHLPLHTGLENQLIRDISIPLAIPEDIKSLKILVVDDEEYNRLLFRKILGKWKIQCEMVSGGMEAIEILKERKFDIMFMDIRMPGTDGFKTTQIIRKELKIRESQMQVVCISAVSGSEERTKYRQAGMNAFLRKPFTEEMLLTTILEVRKHDQAIFPAISGEDRNNSESGIHRINLDNLNHISGGDDQFVKQMLTSFNNTTSKGLKEMQEAARAGTWEAVADLAHKMLPPCRHIGAMELHSVLSKIEDGVSKKSPAQSIVTLIVKSLGEFEAVSELVNEYIAKLK
jgi:signal transduction histidine kinase/CheY-like chemotaxis protein/HPt (histidine-containing phosphotransfer) domain-containing protein